MTISGCALGMLLAAFWSIGALLEAGLAWGVMLPLGWRWLTLLSALLLVVPLLLWPVLPESPQFLCAVGRYGRAMGRRFHCFRSLAHHSQ